ncbi:MAG: flavodoxin domain-containing protein [Anaerolineae bacterium]|nr:flavodoxin domain-containing protein [Anaerolineae bacterium]
MQERNKISRRRFLAWAGAAVGAGILSCGGTGLLVTRQPKIELVESNCGQDTQDRILVTYASQTGTTGEVAQAIGQTLCGLGVAADVLPVNQVSSLDAYAAVVVGGAIYMGRWLSGATKFVQTHRETLSRMPSAYFLVCGTLQEDTEENRRTAAVYLDPLRKSVPEIKPVDVGLFAGRIDYTRISPLYRMIMKGMDAQEGDFRDWDAIHVWAARVQPDLTAA